MCVPTIRGRWPPDRSKNGSTDSADRVASWAAAGVDCFSGGSEPAEWTANPPAMPIAARCSILMAMVPPSAPRSNRTLSEMVPEGCLTLALERLFARRPGIASPPIRSSAAKWAPIYSARQVPQCVGSELHFPIRPNGVTIRSQGTKAPVRLWKHETVARR